MATAVGFLKYTRGTEMLIEQWQWSLDSAGD